MSSRRRLSGSRRRPAIRRYKKLFLVATEGRVTEFEYFTHLRSECALVHVECLRGKDKSAPLQVLERIRMRIKDEGLNKSDEAWLVVDRDEWSPADLDELDRWQAGDKRFGLAVSNPSFELWLLMHFENANGAATKAIVKQRLATHIPGYDKGVPTSKIDRVAIENAIAAAKQKDSPPTTTWPQSPPATTVYHLVQRILAVV